MATIAETTRSRIRAASATPEYKNAKLTEKQAAERNLILFGLIEALEANTAELKRQSGYAEEQVNVTQQLGDIITGLGDKLSEIVISVDALTAQTAECCNAPKE